MIDPSRARRILAGAAASVFAIAGAAGTTAVLMTAPALAAGHSTAGHSAAGSTARQAVAAQANRVTGGTSGAAAVPGRLGRPVMRNCFITRRPEGALRSRLCIRPHGK
jgi:type IV secretory pathway TrbL component